MEAAILDCIKMTKQNKTKNPNHYTLSLNLKAGHITQTCNFHTPEAEAGGLSAQGQPGLHSKIQFQNILDLGH